MIITKKLKETDMLNESSEYARYEYKDAIKKELMWIFKNKQVFSLTVSNRQGTIKVEQAVITKLDKSLMGFKGKGISYTALLYNDALVSLVGSPEEIVMASIKNGETNIIMEF
jgi:hypothetical protein